MWGCFAKSGVGELVEISGIMNSDVYINILKKNLKKSAKKLKLGNKFIFQQDNDPKHTSKATKKWLADNKVTIMDWPAQSPDMNPIENLWSELETRIRSREVQPSNKYQLFEMLQEEWKNISLDITSKLVASVPRRITDLLSVKGGHTKY